MRLQKVKINPHNRLKILCSYCDLYKHEAETYADLDTKFRYVCQECAGKMMLLGKNARFVAADAREAEPKPNNPV